MIPTMPIASMLDLPEVTLTGCEGGIEIVLLSELPEERDSLPPAESRPIQDRLETS